MTPCNPKKERWRAPVMLRLKKIAIDFIKPRHKAPLNSKLPEAASHLKPVPSVGHQHLPTTIQIEEFAFLTEWSWGAGRCDSDLLISYPPVRGSHPCQPASVTQHGSKANVFAHSDDVFAFAVRHHAVDSWLPFPVVHPSKFNDKGEAPIILYTSEGFKGKNLNMLICKKNGSPLFPFHFQVNNVWFHGCSTNNTIVVDKKVHQALSQNLWQNIALPHPPPTKKQTRSTIPPS